MKLFVGNTDPGWYFYLAQNEVTSEVNFWRPSGAYAGFHAISPGELFFFRLRRPYSKVVGFGTFAVHSLLPIVMAWETFGEANGCESLPELVALITKHRGETPDPKAALSWQIGCTILTDVHYYPEAEWQDFYFAPGIVQGKSLEVSSNDGQRLWSHMRAYLEREHLLSQLASGTQEPFSLVKESQASYITATAKERKAQGAFRVMVLDAYNRRCCVSGERTLPVIEAAHIQKYVSPESNHVQNGLALREDIHTLYDGGYVAVDEDYRFVVSPRLREDFENGREYYKFHGRSILLPSRSTSNPSRESIRWHLDEVYRG